MQPARARGDASRTRSRLGAALRLCISRLGRPFDEGKLAWAVRVRGSRRCWSSTLRRRGTSSARVCVCVCVCARECRLQAYVRRAINFMRAKLMLWANRPSACIWIRGDDLVTELQLFRDGILDASAHATSSAKCNAVLERDIAGCCGFDQCLKYILCLHLHLAVSMLRHSRAHSCYGRTVN